MHPFPSLRWLAAASLAFAVGCSGSSTPPAGNGSTSSGTSAGSGSTSTGSSGTSGSSGSTGGTTGGAPRVSGTLTWNSQPVSHPAFVGVFIEAPGEGVMPALVVETDATGHYAIDLDAGSYYLGAAYAPGDAGFYPDGGATWPLLPDAGGALGYSSQGLLGAYPAEVSDPVTVDGDLSELRTFTISLTVNATPFIDAGIPPGGMALPDGGELFPLLAEAALGGVDPTTGIPVEDISSATVTPPSASAIGLGLDTTQHLYVYATPIQNLTGWKAATDGTYAFSASGSNVLGATVPRQLDVHPFTSVPTITSPADGSSHTVASDPTLTVSWVDVAGSTSATVNVFELGASETKICAITPATNPVQVGAAQPGCSSGFVPGRAYRIEVIDTRTTLQAEGASVEGAYAAARVQY